MIKLIVIARCMPEDVYPRSIEQPTAVLPGEKKFSVVVRDPESWYIGRLALEIKRRYESLYRRDFGQIKYLKDGDDDCDLDPELFVADLLVDEGKAARDGADQKRVVKVIQEQGRAIREGSVIPDLARPHYEPPERPPVPKFPGIEKRIPDDAGLDTRPSKRRRLDQIDEDEGEEIVRSIEGNVPANAINGETVNRAHVQIKQESPESTRPWVNPNPATRDELELLPQQPENWRQHSRPTGLSASSASKNRGGNARSVSSNSQDIHQPRRAPSTADARERIANRLARQHSLTDVQTPITPPYTANASRTPGTQAVSMLNGMKSASPVMRQSASSSANKFRKQRRDIFDHPESEIEDSQMSPGSRAAKSRIAPKLIRTPQLTNAFAVTSGTSVLASTKHDVGLDGDVQMNDDASNKIPASVKSLKLPKSRYLNQDKARLQHDQKQSRAEDRISKSQAQAADSESMAVDMQRNSAVGSDHDLRAGRKDSTQTSKSNSKSGHRTTASRSSSIASSSRLPDIARSQGKKIKRVALTKVADTDDGYDPADDGTLDSPGAQLEESLRQSSPIRGKSKELTKVSRSQKQNSKDHRRLVGNISKGYHDINSGDDVERPPESVSDDEEALPPVKKLERRKVESQSKDKGPDEDLRCFTCWQKQNRCDNKKPKCSSCERQKKNCQEYAITREAAEQERRRRKANPRSAAKSTPKSSARPKKKASKARLSEEFVTASDRDDNSVDQAKSQDSSVIEKQRKQPPVAAEKPERASEAQAEEDDYSESGEVSVPVLESQEKRVAKLASSGSKSAKAPSVVTDPSSNLTVPKDRNKVRDLSAESQAASDSLVLPPGMTLEEFNRTVKQRAGLTEEQRKAQKMLDKKAQKPKDSTPVVARSQSSQDLAKSSSRGTPSVLSDEKVPSSMQEGSKSAQQAPPKSSWKAVNSAEGPAQAKGTKPDSNPISSKSNKTPSTTKSTEKTKLKLHPAVATTAAMVESTKHQNPPFRPPQAKVLPARPALASVGTPKSLSDIRAKLNEQKKTGSGASTPQPQTAAAKLAAKNLANKPKKGFSLDDEDEDEDEDETASEDEEEEEDRPKSQPTTTAKSPAEAKPKTPASAAPAATSSASVGQVTVRRREPTPSDGDSESSGSTEW